MSVPLRRIVETRHGYDCVANPCGVNGCGTNAGSGHGRHGDEWVYVVTDGAMALSLVVFTNILNGKPMPGNVDVYYPKGADLSAHVSRPNEDQIRNASKGQECAYIDADRCFSGWSSGLSADEFFKEYGYRANIDQPEPFWRALEAKWADIREQINSEPLVKRCEHCEGRGVVPEVSQ